MQSTFSVSEIVVSSIERGVPSKHFNLGLIVRVNWRSVGQSTDGSKRAMEVVTHLSFPIDKIKHIIRIRKEEEEKTESVEWELMCDSI